MGLPDPNDVAAYDELEQRLIGGPMPLTRPIELHDYDARWPDLYAEHAARLRAALGKRLPAKPLIDIALEVSDSADETAYVPRSRGRRLRTADPRARLVRAPPAPAARRGRPSPRVLGELRGDRPDGAGP